MIGAIMLLCKLDRSGVGVILQELSRVHNILSPFRHNQKRLIFQWAFTLRNAGIGSGSIPTFRSVNAL